MVGTTIGKYRIVEKLGRGGMGTVYKAVDETLDREVAVKVLNSDVDDSTLMARFRAEAKTVARLNHPQIATIYEIYRSDTDLLMVMELVRGETLDKLSARVGPLPIEQSATLMVQVLGALAHAHRAGIVHRDLKPANLMITESGTVKVMDFGIARVLGAEHLTMDGMLMGTPAYMAPEQVMGHDVDARTDLYSVGVVFYRLLTGCLPFQADTPIAIVRKQLSDPPTPARTYRADLPEWCETILDRALAKEPAERFQSAEEFRSALVSAIGHSNMPMGVFGSEYLPHAYVPPAAAPRSGAPTPSNGMTPLELAELAGAPTILGEPTPIAVARDERADTSAGLRGQDPADADITQLAPNLLSASAEAAASEATLLASDVTLLAPVATDAADVTPPAAAQSIVTTPEPAIDSVAVAQAAAPAVASAASTSRPAAATSKSGSSRTGVYALAAVAALVIVAAALGMTMFRGGSTAPAEPDLGATAAPAVSAPAESTPVDTGSTPTSQATADTAGSPAQNAGTAVPAAGAPASPAAGSASRRTNASPAVAAASTAAAVPAPEPLESSPLAADAHAPAPTVAPAAAALPPLVFSAQTVVVEGGRNRQRDSTVQVGNGNVTVTGKDNKVITTVPFSSVVGFTYSNSKQPMWNSPQGPAEITHLDGGAFGFLKGDQHWVSLRTESMSLVLRVRDQDSRRVVAGIEERTGRKVEVIK
jgi:serine/threonine-protein kinase